MFNLPDEIDLWRGDKHVVLLYFSIQYTWKNIKKSFKNNKFKISGTTWNEEFELPDGSYTIWEIKDYFEYNIKMYETTIPNIC